MQHRSIIYKIRINANLDLFFSISWEVIRPSYLISDQIKSSNLRWFPLILFHFYHTPPVITFILYDLLVDMYVFKSTSKLNSEPSHKNSLNQQDHSKSLSEWWVLYNNLKPYRFSLSQVITEWIPKWESLQRK
jgi:hypothetical protein